MPTVIDSLVVLFGLDPSGYKKGEKEIGESNKRIREGSEKTQKEMEFGAKKTAQSINKLKNEVVGMFAAVVGGNALIQFTKNLIDTGAATGRMAGWFDISTKTLSTWQIALQESGGKAEDATNSISGLVGIYQSMLLMGDFSKAPILARLGINSLDELKNAPDALIKMSQALSKMDKATGQSLMGQLGQPAYMTNFLQQGPDAVRAALGVAGRDALTDKQASDDAAMQKRLRNMQQNLLELAKRLLDELAPYIDGIVAKLNELVTWAQANPEIVKAGFLIIAGGAIALTAALMPEATIIAAVVGALFALGEGLKALKNDFDAWKSGGDSLIDWSEWSNDIDEAMGSIRPLLDALHSLAKAMQPILDAMKPVAEFIAGELTKAVDDFVHQQLHLFTDGIHILTDVINTLADALNVVMDLLQGRWKDAWTDAKKYVSDSGSFFSDAAHAIFTAAIPGYATGDQSALPGPSMSERQHAMSRRAAALARGEYFGDAGSGTARQHLGSTAMPELQAAMKGGSSSPAARAMAYFMSKGWTREQAAGIVASAIGESGMSTNPKGDNDGGQAAGMFQWHHDRQLEFQKMFGHGVKQGTFDEQLAFANYELTKGSRKLAGAKLRAAKNAHDAAEAVVRYFEAPADIYGNIQERAPIAQRLASAAANSRAGGSSTSKTVQVHVASLTIHTQATDARGIARDLVPALQARLDNTQADTGLA